METVRVADLTFSYVYIHTHTHMHAHTHTHTHTHTHSQEPPLENLLQALASDLGPVYKWLAPDSYSNQIATQKAGQECRLGNGGEGEERPFSGITCCMDFCAHSHYDRQNMVHGGATVVRK